MAAAAGYGWTHVNHVNCQYASTLGLVSENFY